LEVFESIFYWTCLLNTKCCLCKKYILLLKNNKLYTEFIGFGRKSIIIVFIIIFYFELSNVEGYALIISLEYL